MPLCANCGIVIRWQPTTVHGRAYCCAGCALGGPCECDYDHLPARAVVIRRIRFEITGVGTDDAAEMAPTGSNKALTTV